MFYFLAVYKQQVVGRIFLWSLICPALENPELFGIVNGNTQFN